MEEVAVDGGTEEEVEVPGGMVEDDSAAGGPNVVWVVASGAVCDIV